jgi:hypothetical protein
VNLWPGLRFLEVHRWNRSAIEDVMNRRQPAWEDERSDSTRFACGEAGCWVMGAGLRRAGVLGILAAISLCASGYPTRGSTIWTGPLISFTDTQNGFQEDVLTTNVALTRGTMRGGLYNAVCESSAITGISPSNTMWAFGDLSDYSNLQYGPCVLEAGDHPSGYIGSNFVVYLTKDDVYLSLTLTAWGGEMGSGPTTFTYLRSTPPPPTPTVSITNPAAGTVFAAPANLKLGASASVSSGTVTNVQFFANTNSLGSVTAPPFDLTSSNLAAGAYALMAVATASGVPGTSSVVNVSVVNPVMVTLSGEQISSGRFVFNYTANTGLTYVVQNATNVPGGWTGVQTNVAGGGMVPFSAPLNPRSPEYYRVGRLPNP